LLAVDKFFIDSSKHYINNLKTGHEALQRPEGIYRAEVIYVNLAVEEEILHGGPMTSVINISRDSRINWPGNSVYLYHLTSNEQV
jgi:hypothetical protein